MKKKIKPALTGVLIGIISFLLFHFVGCTTSAKEEKGKQNNAVMVKEEQKSSGKVKHSCCSEDMDKDEYSANSIYQLESKWTDQAGNKIELSKFEGKPVVLTMFFANCSYACPLLVNDMKKIESKVADNPDYQFVLVSIDPDNDTPKSLNNYAAVHGLDLSRWTLLTGKPDNIRELAAVLGFKYKKDNNGQYSHSNLINILDSKGEVVYQNNGLNQDVSIAAEKLTEQKKL